MCLIVVRDDKGQEILNATLPPDFFCNRHHSTSVCQWFLRTREESNAAYWQRISRKKEESSGRLVYRPSNNAPLGILDGKKKCSESIAPRWILSNTPPEWGNQKSPNGQSNTALSNLLVLDDRAVAPEVTPIWLLCSRVESPLHPPRLLQLEISCFHKLLQMT